MKVLAFDYDGTIAQEGLLGETMRAALQAARHAGMPLILATGRRFEDLLAVCPDALALFDRVVAECGAVLARAGGRPVPLVEPVSERLEEALRLRQVPTLRGLVLLATEVGHQPLVEQLVGQLRLDVRVVRNRDSLVIVPVSVSKASGLSHALASLGVTEAEAVAFGDGENDVPMLAGSALGVAVADAVSELRMAADVVLARPGPDCLAEFVLELVRSSVPPSEFDPEEGALV